MERIGVSLPFGLVFAFAALAQQSSGPLTFTLTVSPATPSLPALKYPLMPEMANQTAGNALTKYYKAFSLEWWGFYQRQNVQWHENFDKAMEAPLNQMPADYAFVKSWQMLREVDEGARRDHCDWELIPVLKRDGVATLLPDVQSMRTLARALSLRSRYELADGDIDKAVYSLQTGFALSKHIGEGPSLIHMLVGAAISQIMAKQLDELLQHPKAPNLYWSLARLPRPFVDLRRPVQAESMMISTIMPRYDDLRKGPLPLDEADEILTQFLKQMELFGMVKLDRVQITGQAMVAYPKAKAALVARGREKMEVEQMPVAQVVLLHSTEEFMRLRDDIYKWATLPYYEGADGMRRAEEAFRTLREEGGMLALFVDTLPALQKVCLAHVRIDRRFAMLRVVEALRIHAAMHDRKWPKSLADVKAAPIPLDPMTGKPFEYSVQGGKASIFAPPPPGETANSNNSIVYEITMRL